MLTRLKIEADIPYRLAIYPFWMIACPLGARIVFPKKSRSFYCRNFFSGSSKTQKGPKKGAQTLVLPYPSTPSRPSKVDSLLLSLQKFLEDFDAKIDPCMTTIFVDRNNPPLDESKSSYLPTAWIVCMDRAYLSYPPTFRGSISAFDPQKWEHSALFSG